MLVLGSAIGVAGYLRYRQRWTGVEFVRRPLNPPAEMATLDPAGPLTITDDDGIVTEPRFEVAIDVPDGSEAMQIGTDPTFADAEWQPAVASAVVPLDDQGFQVIFARFRGADGVIGPIHTTGAEVDLTWEAATSSDGASPHRPSWVRLLTPTELVVRIEAGRLVRGALEPFDVENPPDGYRVTAGILGPRKVTLDGETYGFLVSERTDAIRRPDTVLGRSFDVDRALVEPWSITTGPGDEDRLDPVAVNVISRPTGGGLNTEGAELWSVVHDLVIELPAPIEPDRTYRVAGPDGLVEPVEFVLEPDRTLSPAVQVNQVGFAPADGSKLAFFGGWLEGMGLDDADVERVLDGGEAGPAFRVLDVEDGTVMARGTGELRVTPDELGMGDLTGAPVYQLDFSDVSAVGRYRVCVDRVGCSYEFDIGPAPWHDLTVSVARAAYYQRSGIELEPPYATFVRPRPYHPADGNTVVETSTTLLDANHDMSFADIVAGARDVEVDVAWGGHFDAGDWDRRIHHLWYVRSVAQLMTAYGDRLGDLDLNIPESGDDMPDLLDEALWSLDFYRRLQTPDGGIRGGVEASEHPPPNSTSWTDDLAVYAFDPDPWSSYLYAGVAAEMSVVVGGYDRELGAEYLRSAVDAVRWADDQEWAAGDRWTDAQLRDIEGQRHVAAAALLMATGDAEWHAVFEATADYFEDVNGLMSCHAHVECDAGWLYLQADPTVTDEGIRAVLEESFVRSADTVMATADGTAYRWTIENPLVPLVWGLGSGGAPHSSGLIKAYLLTGDERYRDAMVRSASVALGANPTNSVMVTGFGQEPPRHPLIVDMINGGLPVWPGTPIFGRHILDPDGKHRWAVDNVLTPAGARPDPFETPYLWHWYDVSNVAFLTEFTMHQSHSEALLTFATLSATS